MSMTIRISQGTYERLKQLAEPFVDTPDSVIRRLLGLDTSETAGDDMALPVQADAVARAERESPELQVTAGNGVGAARPRPEPSKSRPKSRGRRHTASARPARMPRAPRGSLMKDEAYELPILRVLADRGGRAGKNEVLDAVEPLLADQLTELDRAPIASGEIRWRNRVQFVRLRLVERGEMERDSPRGIWELAVAGRDRLRHAGDAVDAAGAR
jgi:hypothetical protein